LRGTRVRTFSFHKAREIERERGWRKKERVWREET